MLLQDFPGGIEIRAGLHDGIEPLVGSDASGARTSYRCRSTNPPAVRLPSDTPPAGELCRHAINSLIVVKYNDS
jgi:hypothetical protein